MIKLSTDENKKHFCRNIYQYSIIIEDIILKLFNLTYTLIFDHNGNLSCRVITNYS